MIAAEFFWVCAAMLGLGLFAAFMEGGSFEHKRLSEAAFSFMAVGLAGAVVIGVCLYALFKGARLGWLLVIPAGLPAFLGGHFISGHTGFTAFYAIAVFKLGLLVYLLHPSFRRRLT